MPRLSWDKSVAWQLEKHLLRCTQVEGGTLRLVHYENVQCSSRTTRHVCMRAWTENWFWQRLQLWQVHYMLHMHTDTAYYPFLAPRWLWHELGVQKVWVSHIYNCLKSVCICSHRVTSCHCRMAARWIKQRETLISLRCSNPMCRIRSADQLGPRMLLGSNMNIGA